MSLVFKKGWVGYRHYVAWKHDERFLAGLKGAPSRSWWKILAEAKRQVRA